MTVKRCLHRFCKACIAKSLRMGQKECPKCRQKMKSLRFAVADEIQRGLVKSVFPDIDREEADELAALSARAPEMRAAAEEHAEEVAMRAREDRPAGAWRKGRRRSWDPLAGPKVHHAYHTRLAWTEYV
jgi:E3 ubiquitin-protein ligase RNF1/2